MDSESFYAFNGDRIDEQIKEIHVWFDKWDTKVWYTTLYNMDEDSVSESATSQRKSWALDNANEMAQYIESKGWPAVPVKVFTREGVMQ